MSIDAYFKAAVTLCDTSSDTVTLTVSVALISVTDAAVVNSAVTSGEASTDSITVNAEDHERRPHSDRAGRF